MALVSCTLFFSSCITRHTRLEGDWSSDVCSSDLDVQHAGRASCREARFPRLAMTGSCSRSEERRVGKEVRARLSHLHSENTDNELRVDFARSLPDLSDYVDVSEQYGQYKSVSICE